LFGVPLKGTIGSVVLANSITGTTRAGWMVGISTGPSMEETAAKWSAASAPMALAIIPPLEIPVM
jgi:hypothetical protein